MNSNGIDTNALVNNLYAGKAKLEEGAKDASYVGGLHLGGFGIPNQFLGFDMRSDEQKAAQAAPQRWEDTMNKLLATLNAALDSASSPYSK